jgi:branched-chain amino acid transport system permease protein
MNLTKFAKENSLIFGYVAFLFIMGFFLPLSFLVDIIIFSIYALGFDITCGYMGWLSLGQVLYLGVGAYTTALFIKYVNPNPFLALVCSLASGAFIGFILSFVVLRKGGPYFALLNLAFASVGYFFVLIPFKDFTGGNDGTWFRMESLPFLNLRDRNVYFTFLVTVFMVILIIYRRFASSSFSYLLRAIKGNETRVAFLGYNTFRIKVIAFVLSVTLSTLAGSLYSMAYGYASPSFMEPRRCGEVVVATLIGGTGTLYGVLLGSFIIIGLKDLISAFIVYWELFIGLIFVVMMLISRRGVYSLIVKVVGRGQ